MIENQCIAPVRFSGVESFSELVFGTVTNGVSQSVLIAAEDAFGGMCWLLVFVEKDGSSSLMRRSTCGSVALQCDSEIVRKLINKVSKLGTIEGVQDGPDLDYLDGSTLDISWQIGGSGRSVLFTPPNTDAQDLSVLWELLFCSPRKLKRMLQPNLCWRIMYLTTLFTNPLI